MNLAPNIQSKERVVAVVSDLIFKSKMQESAKQLGAQIKFVASIEDLKLELASHSIGAAPIRLILLDLNSKAVDAFEVIKVLQVCSRPPEIVAYLSHVDDVTRERAIKAGLKNIMPRSKFTIVLPELLSPVH